MATAPILGGTTMAYPSECEIVRGYYGSSQVMADGSMRLELVNANPKHTITMSWRGVTTAQKDTILTAVATTATASVAFTAPTGTVYTLVTRSGEDTDLKMTMIPTSNGNYRWNVGPLKLREV